MKLETVSLYIIICSTMYNKLFLTIVCLSLFAPPTHTDACRFRDIVTDINVLISIHEDSINGLCYDFSLFVVIKLVLAFGTGQDNNRQQSYC
jgi:hypothetical protein